MSGRTGFPTFGPGQARRDDEALELPPRGPRGDRGDRSRACGEGARRPDRPHRARRPDRRRGDLHQPGGPTTYWTTINAEENLPGVVTPLSSSMWASRSAG